VTIQIVDTKGLQDLRPDGVGIAPMPDEQADLETGSLVIVPPSAVRAISAAGHMHVLVMQAR